MLLLFASAGLGRRYISRWLQAMLCRLLDEISEQNRLVCCVAPFVALMVDQIKEAPIYIWMC